MDASLSGRGPRTARSAEPAFRTAVPPDSTPTFGAAVASIAVAPHPGDAPVRPGGDRSVRPLRGGPLRDLLDAEFQRCHRFETLGSFFGDLRSLLKKAVVREEEAPEFDRFLPQPPGRE